MTDGGLKEIFINNCKLRTNPISSIMYFDNFKSAISDYEAEKAKEKLITPVEPTDTEIIEYYEQVAKEELPEKETCKWVIDYDENAKTSCGKGDAWYEDMNYCPNCGKPIEVFNEA